MPIIKRSSSSTKKVVKASSSPLENVKSSSTVNNVVTLSLPINIIKSKPATQITLDVTDLGPLAQIAATDVNLLVNGTYLVFDSIQHQFISTTTIGAATTSIAGFDVIQGVTPSDNAVIGFNSVTQQWEYDTPYDIVDLSDGVEDDSQDFGSF